jgi:hypothetical protein
LLVDLVVIDIELSREDHGSIPATAIKRGLKPLMSELTLKSDSTGEESQK